MPVTLLAAHWTRRAADRAADATEAAGHEQSRATVAAARLQERAVLRSAIRALEDAWCPRNAEWCEDPHHNSAHVAWELLAQWGRLEQEERWEKLDLLEFTLRESRAMGAEEIGHVLEVANSVAYWDELIGGIVRDPLLERFRALRDAFVGVAYGSLGPVA